MRTLDGQINIYRRVYKRSVAKCRLTDFEKYLSAVSLGKRISWTGLRILRPWNKSVKGSDILICGVKSRCYRYNHLTNLTGRHWVKNFVSRGQNLSLRVVKNAWANGFNWIPVGLLIEIKKNVTVKQLLSSQYSQNGGNRINDGI